MKKVWKYELKTPDEIEMPKGAKILDIALQGSALQGPALFLWALVNPEAETETRNFIIVGTNHPVQAHKNLSYIGTAHLKNHGLVLHVFEDRGV